MNKLDGFMDILSYYTLNDWVFNDFNTQELLKKLSPTDQKLFPFDATKINWNKLVYNYTSGMKAIIVKESFHPKELDLCFKRWDRNRWINVIAISLFGYFFINLTVSIFNFGVSLFM